MKRKTPLVFLLLFLCALLVVAAVLPSAAADAEPTADAESAISPQALTAVVILVATIILYLCEILPPSITALISCLAMGISGAASYKTVFSGFSNDITLMIIGICIVGDTLFATGAASFLGKKLIRLFGKRERLFLLLCVLLTAVLSAFLSNSATVAMMLPIAAAAAAASGGRLQKKYIYMPIGFAAVAGGGLTLIGSTPQLIAQGMLKDAGLAPATFFEYFLSGLPKVLLLLLFFATIGYALMKRVCTFPEVEEIAESESKNSDNPQKFTPQMLISLLILAGCVLCFVLQIWSFGMISMLGATLCIVTRCVTAKNAFRNLNWTAVILIACALGFAACLNESGAGKVIANFFVSLLGKGVSPLLLCAVVGTLASLLGNLISTTAATAILAPICLFMAPGLGFDARALVILVVVFSNIVYTSPTSTPPNAMTLIAGYRYRDFVKVGGILNIVTILVLLLLSPLLFPTLFA